MANAMMTREQESVLYSEHPSMFRSQPISFLILCLLIPLVIGAIGLFFWWLKAIGTTLTDPNIDFAKIAQGMGVHAEGPITDPKDLAPALRRAIAVVKRGEPALLDVVTQPR